MSSTYSLLITKIPESNDNKYESGRIVKTNNL